MGDDKVKESPSEVFATVADVNSAIHSLDDVFGVRFEAIDVQFQAVDARFQAVDVRFQAVEEKLAEMDINDERRFEAIDAQFRAIQEKMAATDVNNERRFGTLGTEIAELNARVEGGFGLLVEKINAQDLKVARSVTSATNKLLIMMLVIAGSIIASLLYVG